MIDLRYFEDDSFKSYIAYLQYWKKPEYAQFITYPSCLLFLDLLQSKEFSEAVAKSTVAEFIHSQQYLSWSQS
jgi:mediator of RNA polymerase II transcription subunit 31